MSRFRVYMVSAVLCSVMVLGHGDTITPQKPAILDLTPPTKEPEKLDTLPDTIPTTTAPVTDPPKPSPIPNTTVAPTPASTPAPNPTPAPTPTPNPVQKSWNYTADNITCIVVQFAAQFKVTYVKQNSTVSTSFLLNVPPTAEVVDGSCGFNTTMQWITIGWPSTNSSINNTVAMEFQRNDTAKDYSLQNLTVYLAADNFFNSSITGLELKYHSLWRTPVSTSYRCAAPTQLNMTTPDPVNVAATLTLSQLQEEAFRNTNGTAFSTARDCASGDVPDAVPIAVGCALGGLVVVVLVAYLIGRRRSAARGYLSM